MTTNFLLLLALLFPSILSLSSQHHCETEADCAGNFITCLDNRCVCDEDEERRLESIGFSASAPSSSSSCRGVALVGDHCDNVTHICTANATCSPTTRECTCNPGFETYIHAKECKRVYGSKCDAKWELCNPEKFLTCDTPEVGEKGKCACSHADLAWDSVQDACVPPIGGQCDLKVWMGIKLGCGAGAECIYNIGDGHFGMCECLPGYYSEVAGEEEDAHQCYPIFGRVCKEDEICGGGDYTCHVESGTCQCKEGHVYQNESTTSGCRIAVGQPCQGNNNSCVSNAACTSGSSTCECLPDYVPTSGGTCLLGFGGRNCSLKNPCHTESGLICAPFSTTCSCRDGFIYDLDTGTCLGTHGTDCVVPFTSVDIPSALTLPCVPHATCHVLHHVCLCEHKFAISRDSGLCHHTVGTPCQTGSGDECLPDLGMTCTENSTCSCYPGAGTIYDESQGACLLKVGQPCNLSAGKKCIKRAFCGTRDLCQCYHGYAETPLGDCLASHGLFCNTGSEEDDYDDEEIYISCNNYAGLECIDKKCACPRGSFWEENAQKCDNSSRPDFIRSDATISSHLMSHDLDDLDLNAGDDDLVTTPASYSHPFQNQVYFAGGVIIILVIILLLASLLIWYLVRKCRNKSDQQKDQKAMQKLKTFNEEKFA
ncbi:multiple epidermal growth factor-like domains protein 10 [Folsomia candida]|uniref:multiple epidermal growth factor-like domains protein 10 n=1 Tax=Folsomia candida TaxID=158441 RepID=UPI000B8F10A2|nr:multiple epidermal growth factor-like domains protein 10 [Folsomia candida]XP_035714756.1 multiple epidermal growth factor-like domains protein 10 [Folsomia candida]